MARTTRSARSSSGYREYKSDTDSCQNAVVSFAFVRLGEAVAPRSRGARRCAA